MKQLAIKLESWQREVEAAPAFEVAAREFLVRECRAGLELEQKLAVELSTWERELAAAQTAAQAVVGRAEPNRISARDQELNFANCGDP